MNAITLIPESAPFNTEQRAWLNGFLAGWLGLQGEPGGAGAAIAEPEPAADDAPWHDPSLPFSERLAMAEGRPLACFGEVGLTGELRYVAHAERRVAEALKFGLSPILGPRIEDAPRGLEMNATLRAALGPLPRPGTET